MGSSPADIAAPPRALFRGADAPRARTLLDVLDETTRRHPHATALDDGRTRLDYTGLRAEAGRMAQRLRAAGIGRGDRVGVRIPSGTVGLYVAIVAVLTAGAAYVPVDADDPDERAELVFGEARVRAVVGETAGSSPTPHRAPPPPASPERTPRRAARPRGRPVPSPAYPGPRTTATDAPPPRTTRGSSSPPGPPAAQGRGGDPPQRGGVRGRRGGAVSGFGAHRPR
ncbi:AMP-binding protein [Streptosporangium longisporum]|uniref:AMP-binding protein n=1 Tax=Streptosporangium longisporum TaxID=46187 RepID=UPI0031E85FFA